MKKLVLSFCLLSGFSIYSHASPLTEEFNKNYEKMFYQQTGRMPTPQEKAAALQNLQNIQNRMLGGVAALQTLSTQPQIAQASPAPVANTQYGFQVKDFSNLVEPVSIQQIPEISESRTGFSINNKPYIDPEGKIIEHKVSTTTGNVVYAIKSGEQVIYKFINIGRSNPAAAFATFDIRTNQVNTFNGQKLAGDDVAITSDGLLIMRTDSALLFSLKHGLSTVAIPNGWNIARFQRGDISNTRYILLEKFADAEGSVGDLLGGLKDIGKQFGSNKKEDYALLNIDNSNIQPLNVSLEGKKRYEYSDCVKKNKYVNECSSMNSYDSLYKDFGRNLTHYYWAIDWFNTPKGVIALTSEKLSKVTAVSLSSGATKEVFSNPLGMNNIDFKQHKDGRVAATANWLAKKYHNNDVASLF